MEQGSHFCTHSTRCMAQMANAMKHAQGRFRSHSEQEYACAETCTCRTIVLEDANVPVLQETQEAASEDGTRPAAQDSHVEAPALVLTCPLGHDWQAPAPGYALNVPATRTRTCIYMGRHINSERHAT